MDNLFYYIVKSRRQEQDKSPIVKYLEQISESKEAGGNTPYVRILDNRRAIIDKFRAREEYKKLKEQEQAEIKQAEKEQAQAVKDFAQAGFQELKKLIKNNPLT